MKLSSKIRLAFWIMTAVTFFAAVILVALGV